MSDVIEKVCANCGNKNFVYSPEYVEELAKGEYEEKDYQNYNKLKFINIERCKECGYCNVDISKSIPAGLFETEKYKKLQNFSKFEENKDNHFHFLLTGAYVLEQTKDYLNASRAYYNVRKNLRDKTFNMARESLTEEQLREYKPVFDYYEKIMAYCLENAIELAKKQYELDGNIDALLLLFYYTKVSEDKEKSQKLKDVIATLNLTEEQKGVYKIIALL